MKLVVKNYSTDEVEWTLEAELITVYKIQEHSPDYLRHTAVVQVFDYRMNYLGRLNIDYGSKWELS